MRLCIQYRGTASAGPGFLPEATSVPPSSLPLYSFRSLACALTCELLEDNVCDFSGATGPAQGPAYGGFLVRDYEVIRRGGVRGRASSCAVGSSIRADCAGP